MINKRILYTDETGKVFVLTPAVDCGLSLDEIAKKDVPVGAPYKIIDVSDLPASRDHRNIWVADIVNPDGVGADYGTGTDWGVIEYMNGVPYKVANQVTGEIKLVGEDA